MMISIIIPVLNEEDNLRKLIPTIFQYSKGDQFEIIVVDGGSTDDSVVLAKCLGAKVVQSSEKSRAAQMNLGAQVATGGIFYFVHADAKIHRDFENDIIQAVTNGIDAGCYRYQFDSEKFLLKMNAWFTRFNGILAGGGDQTLFIRREIFESLGGFDKKYIIMEDFEFVGRLKKSYNFQVLPKSIVVSARKYETNSWLRVQLANLTVFTLYFLKKSPDSLKSIYRKMLNYR
ncbi:TIGR04283 family arsenosugar biosynthesis glycosyltransferase [Belliella aquatica]|uniref:Glycosyl hydrolase n=1 Tax=Belliella aquatica TaxID=1323734 RepID=A0ABQ1LY37_9BACT|nr:TIGR04283 family arsenosugar biosynthesis glycosyltransferase [Belliella aquatica]MCH7405879.1 TIGR04283 family arsenosugar biosynthesis glycosyltransferase [Belliella aquatica]GGC30008.1 glycosyl hydrolase [Belliella aquatica]